MNLLFTALTLTSLIAMIIVKPEAAFPTMISGVSGAITLAIKLAAIYSVWLGVLNMLKATSLDKKLSRLLRPVIKRLFKGESDEAYENISVNLAANMLGMGGVATPAGIRAMSAMQDGSSVATANMILLIVINATSVQLVPATVIALRASAGSEAAANIFLPTLIATTVSTACGILLCKTLSLKKDNDKKDVKGTLSHNFDMIKSDFSKHIAKMRKTK